jgi:hypothetical protein
MVKCSEVNLECNDKAEDGDSNEQNRHHPERGSEGIASPIGGAQPSRPAGSGHRMHGMLVLWSGQLTPRASRRGHPLVADQTSRLSVARLARLVRDKLIAPVAGGVMSAADRHLRVGVRRASREECQWPRTREWGQRMTSRRNSALFTQFLRFCGSP